MTEMFTPVPPVTEQTFTQTARQMPAQCSQDVQAKARAAKRRKYSGNDVLRLMKVLEEAKMDMDRKCFSMNDVVHIVQDELDGMLKNRKCSCADLAKIITMAGFSVTERTLKDYLAKSRKDAKEGNTVYSKLKEHILSQAPKENVQNAVNEAGPSLSSDDVANAAQNAFDEFAVHGFDCLESAISSAMDDIDTKAMAKQHIQDIYAARKRRKKARNAQKRK